jgi:short-subunit dehydrogenase
MKKTAIITGGTKGIGRALVEVFIQNGFDVLTNSRDKKQLETLKTEMDALDSGRLHFYCADFERKEEVRAFANFAETLFPKLNILINNAGIFIPGKSTEEEEGVFEKEISINLAAPYHLTRAILKNLENSEDAYIFNMCSTASFVPYTNGGSYCISKFGLLGFTKILRQELKEKRIGVSAVMPGATLTDSWKGTTLSKEYFMQPIDVARFVWMAWENRRFSVMEEIVLRPYPGDL